MPTLIAGTLGAVAAWCIVLVIWLCFEYPYLIAVITITGVGALTGASIYEEFTEGEGT